MPGSGWGRGGRIKGGGERKHSASTVRGVGRAGACPGASPAAAAAARPGRHARDCAPQASVQVSLPRSSARIAHHAERRLGMLLARRLPVEGLP